MSTDTMRAGVVVEPGTFAVQDCPVITEVIISLRANIRFLNIRALLVTS